MRKVIRVLGKVHSSYEEALKEAKQHDEYRNYLLGYVQSREGQHQAVVFIDNQEGSPVPRGEGIEELDCVVGIKFA